MNRARTVVALAVAVAAAIGLGAAAAAAPPTPGWAGTVREAVSIDMGNGWTSKGELTYPRGTRRRLPVVVLLHGSGHNDMNQTLPDAGGSTFVPIAQTANREGFAVLRFNKRGVTGVGPVLTTDPAQLNPPRPYEQILRDAAAVVRFAARSPRVDPSRIFLLGHSEGTQVASNLAADPDGYGIPRPAGVVVMGVVGTEIRPLLTYQIFGVKLARLHEEFDVDGDGYLTPGEARDGLIGLPAADADTYRGILLDPRTDRDGDGRLAVDAEVGPVFRARTGIDSYPNVPGLDPPLVDYLVDIARFGSVSVDLPHFDGPSLLLNGESDIQTPARAALVADAALAAAGREHRLVRYPGMGHVMNMTTKFAPVYGEPDPAVLHEIGHWLAGHRG